MIEAPDFLPLGSVVTLEGNDAKKLVIIGRALALDREDGKREYFDYALVAYPEGLVGDAAVYSNHDCITEVFHEGFADKEDAVLLEGIHEALAATSVERGNPREKETW